jgi:hypothetical protein
VFDGGLDFDVALHSPMMNERSSARRSAEYLLSKLSVEAASAGAALCITPHARADVVASSFFMRSSEKSCRHTWAISCARNVIVSQSTITLSTDPIRLDLENFQWLDPGGDGRSLFRWPSSALHLCRRQCSDWFCQETMYVCPDPQNRVCCCSQASIAKCGQACLNTSLANEL